MNDIWKSEHQQFSPQEKEFMKITSFIVPKLPGIGNDVGKAFNLYRFLANHLHTPANELVPKITENGKPLFNTREIAHMQSIIATQTQTPYFKQIVGRRRRQHGGAAVATEEDPTRSKFWDKLVHKLSHSIGSLIPVGELCKNWEFYIFFLYALEQMEMIGPFVGTALDSITLSLPVLSDLASDAIQSIFVLLPFPYAALIGDVMGYVVGTLFLLFAIMLNINRKHFGSAFKVSLELIPMFGDILAEAATNFEVAMERAMASRNKMLGVLKPVSPTAFAVADYYVPTVDIRNNIQVPNVFSKNTYKQIGNELQNYATAKLPIPKEKIEKIGNVASKVVDIGPVLVNTVDSLIRSASAPALAPAAASALAAATPAAATAMSAPAATAPAPTVSAPAAAATAPTLENKQTKPNNQSGGTRRRRRHSRRRLSRK